MLMVSIDVIIPSYRLNESNLLPVLTQTPPSFAKLIFYLIVDHPGAHIPESILRLVDHQSIFLLVNEKNAGASFTRNRGVDAGRGDWILFLDDDLNVPDQLLSIYARAAMDFPDEIGFIGLVSFPMPVSDFCKAIKISGSMDIFGIAERKKSFAWGATANFMLKRKAMQGERFSLVYPRAGGGEDVDLFLRIREKNSFQNYKTLPEAVVYHPWWNNGAPDFKRPFRYGLGNSFLPELNPRYAYRDFLNTPETILLAIPLLMVSTLINPRYGTAGILFILGIVIIEMIASGCQTIKRSGKWNLPIIIYILAMRFVYETGIIVGNLSRKRLAGIGERFHDNGRQNKIFFYRSNTHKVIKWILYPLLVWMLWKKFI